MINLRWYKLPELQKAAVSLRLQYETTQIGWLEFALAASRFCLRDASKAYWFLNVVEGRWQRFDGTTWCSAETVPERLEGLEALYYLLEIPEKLLTDEPDPFQAKSEWQPVEAYQTLVQFMREKYHSGSINSSHAEVVLSRLQLLDQNGSFCALGFRSDKWYAFRDDSWAITSTPPADDELVRWPGALDKLSEKATAAVIRFFLLGASWQPEPITDEWNPPDVLPDMQAPGLLCPVCSHRNPLGSHYCNQCGARLGCPNCGAENPAGSRFCNQCGQALAEQKGPA